MCIYILITLLKYFQIPKEASLNFGVNQETGQPLNYPCVTLKNVYVFPGSPNFLKGSFGALCKVFINVYPQS